jgi:hypothetical protein
MPRVSVVIPAFNAEQFLRPALDSVLTQDYDDFDVIVVNDGSTDGTAAILDEYAAADQRVRVMPQPNQGAAAANNLAIHATDAELIARMDTDDISLPGRLRRLVEYLDGHQQAAAVGTGAILIDGEGRQLARRIDRTKPSRLTADAKVGRRNPVMNPTVMFRRQSWLDAGGERACFIRSHDFDLWVRMAAIAELHSLPECLLLYRIHDGNVSYKTVERQALCGLAATRSAELRRAEQPDPFDHLQTPISEPDLRAAGCSAERCEEAVLAGIAGQIVFSLLARQRHRAESLMRLFEDRDENHAEGLAQYFYRTSAVRLALANRNWAAAVSHGLQLLANRKGVGTELLHRLWPR